jgi:hypothetical protein
MKKTILILLTPLLVLASATAVLAAGDINYHVPCGPIFGTPPAAESLECFFEGIQNIGPLSKAGEVA